jgi:hypothetical protein
VWEVNLVNKQVDYFGVGKNIKLDRRGDPACEFFMSYDD